MAQNNAKTGVHQAQQGYSQYSVKINMPASRSLKPGILKASHSDSQLPCCSIFRQKRRGAGDYSEAAIGSL